MNGRPGQKPSEATQYSVAGVNAHQIARIGEPVDPRDELRVRLLLLDLRTVVLDAFARPRVEVLRRDVEEAALELDTFGRPERAQESRELVHEVVVPISSGS